MTERTQLTALARADLQWFADHPNVCWFDAASPTETMRRRFIKRGWVEQISPKIVGMVKFNITAAGQAVLSAIANAE